MAAQQHHPKPTATAKQTAASIPSVKRQQAQGLTPEQRHYMIAEAAYLIVEQRGFQGDMALNDWLQAEVAVEARLEVRH